MNKRIIGSYVLIFLSAIGYALAFKILSDKGLLNLVEIFKEKNDILLVLSSYLGSLVIPTCLFVVGVKINPTIEFPKAILIFAVIIFATLLVIFFINSKSSNGDWKILKSYETYDFKEKTFAQYLTYIDMASKEAANGRTYLKIANERLTPNSLGDITTIQKVELACSESKFRVISVDVYDKSIKSGLGKLLRSDKDVQGSIAKSFASDGRGYDGGWDDVDQIQRDLIRYCLKKETIPQLDFEQNVNKHLCQQAQRNLDLLKEMCSIR